MSWGDAPAKTACRFGDGMRILPGPSDDGFPVTTAKRMIMIKLMPGRRLRMILAVLVAGFLILCGWIVGTGLNDDTPDSDVAIVLGNMVLPDGQPSPRLAARLDAALALYQQGKVKQVIVSGGTGKEGFSESAVMRDYLVGKGVPAARVIEDPDGVTTWATAENSAAIMRQQNLTSAIVVSQHFHIVRSRLALQAMGIGPVGHAHARIFEWRDLYSTLREIPALAKYYWRSRKMDGETPA